MNNKNPIYMAVLKRRITVFVVLMIFLAGGFCYHILPKQQYPVITLPMVIITATYPGASAEDMEELVTSPLEDTCMAADGFEYVTSESFNSLSVIRMSFDQNLSQEELKEREDDLRRDIEDTVLPDGVTNITYNDDAFDTAGLILAFTGDGITEKELKQRAESLKDELMGMDGVSKVEIEGDRQQQIKVTADSAKLNYLDLSLTNLSTLISAQNSHIPVGTLEFAEDEINITTSGEFEDLDEIKNIVVSVDGKTGAVVKLGDIATVDYGYDDDDKYYTFNGKNAVILNLYFAEGENVLSIGKEVMKTVDKYRASISDGINIENVVYLPDDVNSSINDFVLNLIESVVIVLLVVMVGMSIRNGTIVSVVIPLVIFASFICMKLFGVEINFVSLASLIVALGMLVDNAIVVSDAIQVRIDKGEEKMSACVNGTIEVALPVFASTLTTVIIFSVFFLLPGAMYRLAVGLPMIVISSLSCSFLAALFVTPTMCYFLMKKSQEKKLKESKIRKFFQNVLKLSMRHKFLTFVVSAAAVAASAVLLLSLDLELIPNSDKEIIDINVSTYNYYDIRKTEEVMAQIENILKDEPENVNHLIAVGGHVPKYDFGTQPSTDAVNNGSIIYNVDIKQGGRFKKKAEYRQHLQDLINEKVTGAKVTVTELSIVPSRTDPVSVTFYGDNVKRLNEVGEEAEKILRDVEGTENVHLDRKYNTYNYYIDMNNDELNTCGLTKAEVQHELNFAIMGGEATVYRKNGQEYPVVVKSDISDTGALEDYAFISSITGGKFKLSQFANVGVTDNSNTVTRYNGRKSITLSCNVNHGKSAVEIANALKKGLKDVDLSGVEVKFLGDVDTFNTALSAILSGALMGLFAIIFVLYIQFYSLKRALIILASIPFSIIGASVGLWVTGQNLSFFAIIGIISLLGVVVNNAIVLIDYIDIELKNGSETDTACVDAVEKRFRPILLSTTTTVLGLIPLALTGNVIFRGLSIAFMSGLTTSLLFTLVIIPTICSVLLKNENVIKADKTEEAL